MSSLNDRMQTQSKGLRTREATLDELLQVYGTDGVRAMAENGQLSDAQIEADEARRDASSS